MADRMRRVNESVRQVLSEAVGQLKDPRIGFVTVTGVETSADLRHARVFVSVLGAELAFDQLGKDSIMVLHSDAPLPGEYGFMPLAELRRRWPEDVSERVLVALDCANESRISDEEVLGRVPLTLDIDHHHDNTRFGDINLIVPEASSTGEVLRDLFRELKVELTPEIAEALYVALVTDTGRFQYANTTPKAFRLAAELVEAGADLHRGF